MTDDIVTRLRRGNFDCLHGKEVDVFHLTIDAANAIEARDAEIERLREEVLKAYHGFNYWEERCIRAEECLDFIYRKKRRWRLW